MSGADLPVRKKGLLRRVLAVVLGAVALGYFARQVALEWPGIVGISWTRALGFSVAAAGVLYCLSAFMDAWSWAWLLRGLGVDAHSRDAIGVFLVAQFAKYIPGNVGQHIGRVTLARSRSWPSGTVILSLIVENGFALGIGALTACAGLSVGVGRQASGASRIGAAIVIVVVGWVVGVALLQKLLYRPPPAMRRLLALDKPVLLGRKLLLAYSSVHILSSAALGGALAVIVFGLTGDGGPQLWRVGLAAVVAWFAGYVVPGAPAGLGVREAAVTAILTPLYGPVVAVSAAMLWRLSALLADGGLFLAGLGLRARARTGSA